ncbi:MAG: hypothetical protein HPY54_16835 [Chthonomonadetes bacterium]|nr:hypothetical protein [Chthonomonadetes bacterium]
MPPQGTIRFDAISRAWELLKAQMGMWILISLLFTLIAIAVGLPVGLLLRTTVEPASLFDYFFSVPRLLEQVIMGTVGLVLAGAAWNAALKQIRGEGLQLEALTEVIAVGGQLVVTALLMSIALTLGFSLCILPSLVIGGLLMFSILLVVDQKLDGVEAISRSFEMLKSQWLMATLFYTATALIAAAGVLLCCVGLLFTLPLFYLSIALAYDDFVRGYLEP